MGCDGGTIPRRDELVKTKKKPENLDKDIKDNAKWRYCALTQKELKEPIVACELGRVYNKEAVIEYLLDKETTVEILSHIRNLKDVCTLNLKPNPVYEAKHSTGDEYVNVNHSPFICPIVGLEMTGKYKFVFFWKCGCVISERVLKEINCNACLFCNKPSDPSDIIVLNPDDKDLSSITSQMQERRTKAKKNKRKKIETVTSAETAPKKSKPDSTIVAATASTSKAETDASKPQNKPKTDLITKAMLTGKANPDYHISKDPQASEAFKSLFTSHKNAKNKPKQHWVTHNPCFY